MNAKEAIVQAKLWIREIYEDETIDNIGLEEVKFDHDQDEWVIIIGFSRPWDTRNVITTMAGNPVRRSYKRVRISDRTSDILSVEDRALAQA